MIAKVSQVLRGGMRICPVGLGAPARLPLVRAREVAGGPRFLFIVGLSGVMVNYPAFRSAASHQGFSGICASKLHDPLWIVAHSNLQTADIPAGSSPRNACADHTLPGGRDAARMTRRSHRSVWSGGVAISSRVGSCSTRYTAGCNNRPSSSTSRADAFDRVG